MGLTNDVLISVVVPVFNEEDAIAPFVDAVSRELVRSDVRWEILFVDDGSTDKTASSVQAVRKAGHPVHLVRFARNFGKEAALSAGLDVASGHAVIIMDVDLQDPPALIPSLLCVWSDGADVVYGARADRSSDSLSKRSTARAFYRVFNSMADQPIPLDAGDFRLLDRRVVEALRMVPERSRFMKGLLAWPGFRVESVPYVRPPREVGMSKWSARGLWSYALKGLFNFSAAPLRWWSYIGAALLFTGLVFAAVVFLQALVGAGEIPGYASTIILITVLGGVQIAGIGIVGEVLTRVLEEAKGRPLYVVADSDVTPSAETLAFATTRPELMTFDRCARTSGARRTTTPPWG